MTEFKEALSQGAAGSGCMWETSRLSDVPRMLGCFLNGIGK